LRLCRRDDGAQPPLVEKENLDGSAKPASSRDGGAVILTLPPRIRQPDTVPQLAPGATQKAEKITLEVLG
jgi:hypothetical protein